MTGWTGRGGRRDGGSLLRVGAHIDRIAIIGIALSIIGSIVLDLAIEANDAQAFLACLMGITISLVIDANARAERRFRMRNMIEAAPWLDHVLVPMVEYTTEIERRYAGTVVAAEMRRRYERLHNDLDELRRGRIVCARGDHEHLLAPTQACQRTLQAVTNVAPDTPRGLGWWASDIGRHYWQANLDALDRGVQITRVFAYTQMTAELRSLVDEQRRAGVQVVEAQADTLDPELRFNLAIWDGTSAWEARLNAGGEIIGTMLTVNDADLKRLGSAFERCRIAASLSGCERGIPAA